MKIKMLTTLFVLMLAALTYGQNTNEWTKYTSTEEHYSVLLPQQPKLSSQETTASTGEKFTQYLTRAGDSGSVYLIAYFVYTPGMTFSLDKARDGMVNAIKGTLLSEEAISLGGYPGRELKVSAKLASGEEILTHARIYDIGRRVYALQHMFLKSSDSPAIAEKTAKFFDSFKVTTGN